jgi:sugar phosphate isomerase/epimerase
MKLSVLINLYGNKSLDETLKIMSEQGVTTVEVGAGGYPGKAHCDPAVLLADEAKLEEFKNTFKKYNISICALACHGNALHPDKELAKMYDTDFKNACLLAEKLGVDTVITFSGCPGSDPGANQPSWVTCAWPPEYLDVLDYQWNEVLIPYWKEAVKFANANGVKKIALEMHPGFCVYNPATLLKLREAVGDTIGANLDPSHLLWQGMDIIDVIYELKDAIYYFHAKDTELNMINVRKNGVLDVKHYSDLANRAWTFRTMGYGTDKWKHIISALKIIGYDDSISIEHEDPLMAPFEGLEKAIDYLKPMLIDGGGAKMWWA